MPLLLLTGELGTGKSTLCRALAHAQRHQGRVVYLANALVTPEELYRRLLVDLDAVSAGAADGRRLVETDREGLARWVAGAITGIASRSIVMLVDEAHLLPPATVDALLRLAALERNGHPAVHIVLAAQPPSYGSPTLSRTLEESVLHRARLTPLDRDECEPYVLHRLQVAGGAHRAWPAHHRPAPRLVGRVRRLEHSMFETAATSLELRRLRARRFRW